MEYYTYLGKRVFCKRWSREIPLSAKYVLTSNPDDPYEARFAYAKCPLAENCKIKPSDQEGEFKYLICTHSDTCELLHDFAPIADVREGRC
ncbi:MAG: hypothetical protein LUF84_02465 [Clostridiales bacterium]|nr:hypothetical protein [Clostridiales bacterium]